jgi:hypothetical protein
MKDGSGFDRRQTADELSLGKQKEYYYDERAGDGAAFREMINKWRERNGLKPIYEEKFDAKDNQTRAGKGF